MGRLGRILATAVLACLVLATALAVATLVDRPSRDRAFEITSYQRDVEVQRDGRLWVIERIDVRFAEPRRGIFRDLPASGQAGPVGYADVAVDRGSVERPWMWRIEGAPDGGTRIRIGDPDVTLSPGSYTYRLRYAIDDLTFLHRDRREVAEVRLDVPGFAWPTDVRAAQLRVVLPGEVVEVDCVAGALRSTADCPEAPRVSGRSVEVDLGAFGPERSATVAILVAADAFDPGLPVHRATPLRAAPRTLPATVAAVLAVLLLAVPLVVFEVVKAVRVYRDVETDPALHDRLHPTAVPEPPAGLVPAEVAGLLLRRAGDPLFLASLVDLDQRGVVQVSTGSPAPSAAPPGASRRAARRAEQVAAGVARSVTVRRGPTGEVPEPYRPFVRALLPGDAPLTMTGGYDADAAQRSSAADTVVQHLGRGVFRAHGLEHGEGGALRHGAVKGLLLLAWAVGALLVAAITAAVSSIPFVAVLALAPIVLLAWSASRFLWRHERLPLNSQGRDAIGQARAFDEYLRTVEAEQLEWAATQPDIDQRHPAVRLLPYAIALGLAASWYERFGDLLLRVAPAAAGAGTAWWASRSSFDTFSATRSTSTTAPSSSGGGGGGGGGGSGGGGGGGGSW
jgi:uncharacterized membrane protein YgcG